MTSRADDVHFVPGDGRLFRSGPIIALFPDVGTPSASTLMSGLNELPALDSDGPDDRAWRAVGVIRQQALSLQVFAVAVQLQGRVLFLVGGPVTMTIKTPDDVIELDGAAALTWVDRVVQEPIVQFGTGGDESRFVGQLGRSDGIFPAAGFVVFTSRSAAESGPVASPQDDVTRRPTEVIRRPPPPRAPAAATGVFHQTARALVADDGTRVLLDRDYVFGRSPFRDPTVVQGTASPLVVQDPDHLVSRVQLHVSTRGGQLVIRDSGSANGSFIAEPGAAEWQRLNREPVVLQPGWSIRLGRRVYTYVIE